MVSTGMGMVLEIANLPITVTRNMVSQVVTGCHSVIGCHKKTTKKEAKMTFWAMLEEMEPGDQVEFQSAYQR